MSETTYCFISTIACVKEECPVFHEATGLCKVVMAVNRILGDIDGKPIQTPSTPPSQLVADAMKAIPDISQIKWMIKGNQDARDTDPFAYAFVFKYDAGAKRATNELRTETTELYNYLKAHDNNLELDGFIYSLNREGTLFGRNKARN
jgi:hypothetical protein